MRWFVAALVALVLVWTGLWFYVASRIENGVTDLIATQREGGMEIAHSRLGVGGYPYRFDLSIADLSVTSPTGLASWQAPRVDVQALAYRPTHVILTLPDSQKVTLPGQVLDISSDRLQASIRTGLSADLPLKAATVEGRAMEFRSDAGWAVAAANAVLASRQTQDRTAGPFAHDIAVTLDGVQPRGTLMARIPQKPGETPPAGAFTVDATVSFGDELNLHSLEPQFAPELQRLDLRRVRLDWADIQLSVVGTLNFDAAGRANGDLDLELTGWPQILELAVAIGAIPPEQRQMAETAMRFVERTNFGSGPLRVPLAVRGGTAMLGPVPVFALPPALRREAQRQ